MKLSIRVMYGLLVLMLLTPVVDASPIVWTLKEVVLSDGGAATGTFIFNPDAGTPCGSFGPCGTYSDVHIVTTAGASRAGATYSFVCGEDVPSCTGVSPDSTEVLLLASGAANQMGDSALAFFFTGIGVFPPNGLTDAGGLIEISGSSSAVGILTENSCANASCSLPSGPSRMSIAGNVAAVPEPSTWLLLTTGLGVMTMCFQRRG